MYLIDTNTCIFLKNKKPIHVLEKLKSVLNQDVSVSSLTIAEMQFGVYKSPNIEKNRISLTEFLAPFQIIEFDDRDAEYCGKIRAELKQRGEGVRPAGLLRVASGIQRDSIPDR